MARKVTARIEIRADDKASANIGRVRGSFRKLGTFLASKFVFGIQDVIRVFSKLTQGMKEAVDAAKIQQDAFEGLNAQLSSLGPQSRAVTKALGEQAAELQKVTKFGDEATLQAQAQLAVFTQDEEQLKRLTVVTQDFATAQGTDLVAAAQLLAKTFGSSTNALSRYGIEVEGAAGSSERLDSLTENLTALFGGRAKAAAETYAGAMKQLANAQGDVSEAVGEALTKNEALAESIRLRTLATAELAEIEQKGGTITGRLAVGFANLQLFGTLLRKKFSELSVTLGNTTGEFIDQISAAIGLSKVLDDAADKVDALAKAETDLERITKAIEQASKGFETSLKSLGVTLEGELTDKIKSNNEILEQARFLFQEFGTITLPDLEKIEKAVAKANAELTAKIEGTTIATKAGIVATEDATEATVDYADAVFKAGVSFDAARNKAAALRFELTAVANAARITALQFDKLAATQGTAAAVQAAVAGGGELILSGTRINLPGGGSRLTRPPGFTDI